MKNYLQFINEKLQTEKRIFFPVERMIPDEIIKHDIFGIANLFWNRGYDIYIVGGAPRDSYLGLTPKDYDLVTNALPEVVIDILKGYRILPIGEAFGINKVFTDNENDFEIATFRKESGYSDSRHPDSVEFVDLFGDYTRRDLTINSIYYDLKTSELIDFSSGLQDIKNGTIRTVGNPFDRFKEDKLRKLRCIRFCARFDSEIDPTTDKSLKQKPDLKGISFERIREEFIKGVISSKSTIKFMELIQRYNMFKFIFPGLLIDKNYVEEKNSVIQIAVLLIHNEIMKLKRVLNKLTYQGVFLRDVVFLNEFSKLNMVNGVEPIRNRDDINVFTLKRKQSVTNLSNDQIIKFAEHLGMDDRFVETFLAYEITVNGEDIKHNLKLKGAQIGQEIERQELEIFKKLLM